MSRLLGLALAGVLSSLGTAGTAATFQFEFTGTMTDQSTPFPTISPDDANDIAVGDQIITTFSIETEFDDLIQSPNSTIAYRLSDVSVLRPETNARLTPFIIDGSYDLYRADGSDSTTLSFIFGDERSFFTYSTFTIDLVTANTDTLRSPPLFFDELLATNAAFSSQSELIADIRTPSSNFLGLEDEDIPLGTIGAVFSNQLTRLTVDGNEVDLAPVPLPAAGFLLTGALLGAAGLRRKA